MAFLDFFLLLLEGGDFHINFVSFVMQRHGFTCRCALFLSIMGSKKYDCSNSWCQIIKAASLEFVSVLFLFYIFVYTQIKTKSPMAQPTGNWIECLRLPQSNGAVLECLGNRVNTWEIFSVVFPMALKFLIMLKRYNKNGII